MTLSELRVAWVGLGILLAIAFADHPSAVWFVLIAFPWVVGVAVLFLPHRRGHVVAVIRELGGSIGSRVALLILSTITVLVAILCSVSAALFFSVYASAGAIVLAAVKDARAFREAFLRASMTVSALSLALGLGEIVVRLPAIAVRFGLPSELAAWDQRYDKLWEENILGLRSPYESVKRRPGTRRVLALGDSFSWGEKIADADSTWPMRLERELARRDTLGAIQVINMSRGGYTTANEAELLRRLGWQFDPDLVVVQFLVNDALPSGPNFTGEGEAWLIPRRQLLPVRFRTGPIGSSNLLAIIEKQLNTILAGSEAYRRFDALYREGSRGWAQMQAAIREMADSAQRRGIPIVIMLFPRLIAGTWTADTYPLRAIHEQVVGLAIRDGFHALDLTAHFAAGGDDWRRWWATPYDPHPSSEAHALAAQALAAYVTGQGWLSTARAR